MSAPPAPPAPFDDPEATICFCHNVPKARLWEEFSKGARTFEAVQAITSCSTGCGGCEYEVRSLITDWAALPK